MNLLEGKNAIITGASRGLGKAIAEDFIREGANIIICARNIEELTLASQDLHRLRLNKRQKIYTFQADVSSKIELDLLYENSIKIFDDIHILVNNAGIMGSIGYFEDNDWETWLNTIYTNFISTVYLCKLFIPHFRHNKYGKIINIAGGGSANSRPCFTAYATSKVAVVRFTESIADELKGSGVEANCISPGALNTYMLDVMINAGSKKIGDKNYKKLLEQKENGGSSLIEASQLCSFLASDKSNGISGKLISAVWDNWRDLPNHINELRDSDIYTLRRILPKDRGTYWGNVE